MKKNVVLLQLYALSQIMIFIKIEKQPCIAVLEKDLGGHSLVRTQNFPKNKHFLSVSGGN